MKVIKEIEFNLDVSTFVKTYDIKPTTPALYILANLRDLLSGQNDLIYYSITAEEVYKEYKDQIAEEVRKRNSLNLNFNIYDMLVFIADDGSIYQDCVCCIQNTTEIHTSVECNVFRLYLTNGRIEKIVHAATPRFFKLKEIWRRADKDTFKKVWENNL